MASRKESKPRVINGYPLECQVCKSDTFWERETLMNTPGMTLFGVEWANKRAQNYICDNCGYVHWFLSK